LLAWSYHAASPGKRNAGLAMATEVRFKDANNKTVSGTFEVHDDVIPGRSRAEGQYTRQHAHPGNTGKVLLLQLHKE
jgi:hypothetical protein